MSTPNDTTHSVRRRRPTGQLVRVKTKAGPVSFGLRFQWQGKRRFRTLGSSADGWTKKRAEKEIERLMAALWAGSWDPAADERRQREPEPQEETFEQFALAWYERQRDGMRENGQSDLAWALDHLRAWFGGMLLSEITVEEVERFAHAKRTQPRGKGPLAGEPLSGTSVRKFVRVMRSILAVAVRWERIGRNPAEGIVVKPSGFKGTYLDRAEHLRALLEAAGELDCKRRLRRGHGRALLAVLTLAGLRIDEALSLRWRDVNLAGDQARPHGWLRVIRSKTAAGEREVDLLPLLHDELSELKARRDPERDTLVFGTKTGGKESPSNVRNRLLRPAVERASAALEEQGRDGLPKLTPHSLRRTFATFLIAAGGPDNRPVDPLYVADQLGHEDPAFSLRVYSRAVRRKDGEPERIRALVSGEPMPEVPAPAEAQAREAA